jgi:hypothetical protein
MSGNTNPRMSEFIILDNIDVTSDVLGIYILLPEEWMEWNRVGHAYYVLSDMQWRQEYDAARRTQTPFAFASTSTTSTSSTSPTSNTRADDIFNSVFEELLRPEVAHPMPFWRILGGGSGTVLGFILANVPGLLLGAVIGYRMGEIRDNKGVSVMEAFGRLPWEQKAQLLTGLAKKFVGI